MLFLMFQSVTSEIVYILLLMGGGGGDVRRDVTGRLTDWLENASTEWQLSVSRYFLISYN